jgi:hypothetical protein
MYERLTMAIKMPHAKPDTSDRKAEAFIHAKPTLADPDAGKAVVNMRFDVALLKRIDAAAKNQGISRTAWIHVAASKALE